MIMRDRYTTTTIVLHWLIAVLLLGQFAFGLWLGDIPRGTPERGIYVNLHKSSGLLIGLLIALRDTDRLTVRDLPAEYRTAGATDALPAPCPAAEQDAPVEARLNPLESAERRALFATLQQREWNLSCVARELGISRNTLYRKLERLNIKPPDKPAVH